MYDPVIQNSRHFKVLKSYILIGAPSCGSDKAAGHFGNRQTVVSRHVPQIDGADDSENLGSLVNFLELGFYSTKYVQNRDLQTLSGIILLPPSPKAGVKFLRFPRISC